MRIRWGAVLTMALITGLALLLVRGCVMARRGTAPLPEGKGADPVIRVYDHRAQTEKALLLETYLVGVVAAEMPAMFHPEALKAQAVAARTYTLYHLLHGGCRKTGADVCTDSGCCQAFSDEERMKQNWGGDYREKRSRVASAVTETAGTVLLYDGAPIDALYHSASGGHTENAEDVYAVALPYLRGVESTAEAGTNRLSGEKRWTRRAFCAMVNETYPAAKLTERSLEKDVAVLSVTPGGRAQTVRLGKTTVTGRQLRSLLGLDSTLLKITVAEDGVTVSTKGYGHGVGMSQTGANAMAMGGRTHREILTYYYTDVTFGRITWAK